MKKKCKMCLKNNIIGRSDKIFCSIVCKNKYHKKLQDVTNKEAKKIDLLLHRNRSILLEIMGKKNRKLKVKRYILEKKRFRFKYHTHFHINSKGKMYKYVYDFAWMEFSDDEILIIRKSKTENLSF